MRWNHQDEQKLEIIHILKYCGGFAVFGGSDITCFLCRKLWASQLSSAMRREQPEWESRSPTRWTYLSASSMGLNQAAAAALFQTNPSPLASLLGQYRDSAAPLARGCAAGDVQGRGRNARRWAPGQLRPSAGSSAGRWELRRPQGGEGAAGCSPCAQLLPARGTA